MNSFNKSDCQIQGNRTGGIGGLTPHGARRAGRAMLHSRFQVAFRPGIPSFSIAFKGNGEWVQGENI